MKLEELLKKQSGFIRKSIATKEHELRDYDGNPYILVRHDSLKAKYAVYANEQSLFVRHDLYDLKSDIVIDEVVEVYKNTVALYNKYKEAGENMKSLGSRVKKESLAIAKDAMIAKYGEEAYYKVLSEDRVKKVKQEKKEVKKVIKSIKSTKNLDSIPDIAPEAKVDDVLVKQIDEALTINNEFKEKEQAINNEFDNDVVAIPNVELKVEEVGGIQPMDIGLSEEELSVDSLNNDVFEEKFDLDAFIDDDVF